MVKFNSFPNNQDNVLLGTRKLCLYFRRYGYTVEIWEIISWNHQ